MEYNKNQFSKISDKKVLHKRGKQWITLSLGLLMAIGGTAVVSHADTNANVNTNTTTPNTPQERSNNSQTPKYNLQSATPQQAQSSTNNGHKLTSSTPNLKTIGKQATALHQHIILHNMQNSQTNASQVKSNSSNNNSYSTLNLGTHAQQQRAWKYVQSGINYQSHSNANTTGSMGDSKLVSTRPSFNSAYQSYMAQMSGVDSKIASMNSAKDIQSNNIGKVDKPLLKDGNQLDYQKYFSGNKTMGTLCGLNYINYSNGGVEFTSGTAENNLSIDSGGGFSGGIYQTSNSDGSDVDVDDRTIAGKAKAIKFDNKIDVSHVTDMNGMFSGNKDLVSVDLGNNFNTGHVTNMNSMFSDDENLVNINLGNNFNTSNVTSMNSMFDSDRSLRSLNLGREFNTNHVKDMQQMFDTTSSLHYLDLGKLFDTRNVTNMSGMLNGSIYCLVIQSQYTHFSNDAELPTMYKKGDNNSTASIPTDLSKGDNRGVYVSKGSQNISYWYGSKKITSDTFYGDNGVKVPFSDVNKDVPKNYHLASDAYSDATNMFFGTSGICPEVQVKPNSTTVYYCYRTDYDGYPINPIPYTYHYKKGLSRNTFTLSSDTIPQGYHLTDPKSQPLQNIPYTSDYYSSRDIWVSPDSDYFQFIYNNKPVHREFYYVYGRGLDGDSNSSSNKTTIDLSNIKIPEGYQLATSNIDTHNINNIPYDTSHGKSKPYEIKLVATATVNLINKSDIVVGSYTVPISSPNTKISDNLIDKYKPEEYKEYKLISGPTKIMDNMYNIYVEKYGTATINYYNDNTIIKSLSSIQGPFGQSVKLNNLNGYGMNDYYIEDGSKKRLLSQISDIKYNNHTYDIDVSKRMLDTVFFECPDPRDSDEYNVIDEEQYRGLEGHSVKIPNSDIPKGYTINANEQHIITMGEYSNNPISDEGNVHVFLVKPNSSSAVNASDWVSSNSASVSNIENHYSSISNEATDADNKASSAGSTADQANRTANTASNTAQSALSSASTADKVANNASTDASNAANSASSANRTASIASSNAVQASTNALSASTNAFNASNSATSASVNAADAETSARQASMNAQSASNNAVAANKTADTANQTADQASKDAVNANTKASNAEASAVDAENSARSASSNASDADNKASSAGSTADQANKNATNAETAAKAASTSAVNTKDTGSNGINNINLSGSISSAEAYASSYANMLSASASNSIKSSITSIDNHISSANSNASLDASSAYASASKYANSLSNDAKSSISSTTSSIDAHINDSYSSAVASAQSFTNNAKSYASLSANSLDRKKANQANITSLNDSITSLSKLINNNASSASSAIQNASQSTSNQVSSVDNQLNSSLASVVSRLNTHINNSYANALSSAVSAYDAASKVASNDAVKALTSAENSIKSVSASTANSAQSLMASISSNTNIINILKANTAITLTFINQNGSRATHAAPLTLTYDYIEDNEKTNPNNRVINGQTYYDITDILNESAPAGYEVAMPYYIKLTLENDESGMKLIPSTQLDSMSKPMSKFALGLTNHNAMRTLDLGTIAQQRRAWNFVQDGIQHHRLLLGATSQNDGPLNGVIIKPINSSSAVSPNPNNNSANSSATKSPSTSNNSFESKRNPSNSSAATNTNNSSNSSTPFNKSKGSTVSPSNSSSASVVNPSNRSTVNNNVIPLPDNTNNNGILPTSSAEPSLRSTDPVVSNPTSSNVVSTKHGSAIKSGSISRRRSLPINHRKSDPIIRRQSKLVNQERPKQSNHDIHNVTNAKGRLNSNVAVRHADPITQHQDVGNNRHSIGLSSDPRRTNKFVPDVKSNKVHINNGQTTHQDGKLPQTGENQRRAALEALGTLSAMLGGLGAAGAHRKRRHDN